jgi:RNA polymerase-binding protein DksA
VAKKPPPKPAPKPVEKPRQEAPKPAAPAKPELSKSGRKGITIVTPKPVKKPSKPSNIKIPVLGGPLFKPGSAPKPLIQSGPKAPARGSGLSDSGKPHKTPFDKKTLDRFRQILRAKRAELVGDVSNLETEALQGQSGSLSHLPQHMAEQGSDAAGQSLSLDLAAADRRLIKEIDDALQRIEDGTYGVCELTGKPIKAERLEELPWARYSIEAARELERRSSTS